MPTLSSLKMIGLDALLNPVTIRYNLATSWGITSQELTLNVPDLYDKVPETLDFATRIWNRTIASALCRTCQLSFIEVVNWAIGPAVSLGATGAPRGLNGLSPSDRDHSAVFTLHTGHADRFSRRQIFFPNVPTNWIAGDVLNSAGVGNLYAAAATIFMGLGGFPLLGPIELLIAYPRVLEPTTGNILGVAFRRIEWVRVHNYCARAFDTVPLSWP